MKRRRQRQEVRKVKKICLFLLFLVFVFETAAVYKISPKNNILLQLFQKIRNPKVFGNFGENPAVDEK